MNKYFKAFGIISLFSILSVILGYLREASIAWKFGATAETDAFFSAYFLPNVLYLILLSGGISTAFIPVFMDLIQKDRKLAWEISSSLFNFIALALSLIVGMGIISSSYWVPSLFKGFPDLTMKLTEELTIIIFPMLFFVGLGSLVTAISNSFGRFTLPAMAPLITNIIMLVFIAFAPKQGGIYLVAWGVSIGMLGQLVIQLPIIWQEKGKYSFKLNLKHPAIQKLLRLSLPLILYLIVGYASSTMERNFASTLEEGTISSLNYATRLFSLPMLLFIGPLGTIIYPDLAREISNDNYQSFNIKALRATSITLSFLIPTGIWLSINSKMVVTLLYGYGAFSSQDITLTAYILTGYAIGLAANGTARILQRMYYSQKDTVTPLWIEAVTLVVYVSLLSWLQDLWGPTGLGFARGISFIVNFFISIIALKLHPSTANLPKALFQRMIIITIASLLAALVWFIPILWNLPIPQELIVRGMLGIIGVCIYIAVIYHLNLPEAKWLYSRFRKKTTPY